VKGQHDRDLPFLDVGNQEHHATMEDAAQSLHQLVILEETNRERIRAPGVEGAILVGLHRQVVGVCLEFLCISQSLIMGRQEIP
jgi:hypothetical protein